MIEIIFLSFLAAVFSMDVTVFGQFMISRPIICGPIFGYFLGDIKTGLWAGMIVELIWIGSIPMGAAIPIDATAVAILSLLWSIAGFSNPKAAFVLALSLSIVAGLLFKRLDIWMRYYNIRIVHWIEDGVKAGDDTRINKGVHYGLVLFLFRSFLFYVLFAYAGTVIVPRLYAQLSPVVLSGLEHAWYFLPLVGFGIVVVNFRSEKFPYFK